MPPRIAHSRVWLLSALLAANGCIGCGRDAEPVDRVPVLRVLGEPGISAGQLSYPRGIDIAGDVLIVIDKSGRVQTLDPQTGDPLGGFQMPRIQLGKPTGLTVGPHPFGEDRDVLYVADTHEHRVLVCEIPTGYLPTPNVITTFGRYGTALGEFVYPTDVAIRQSDDTTQFFVSEYGGNDRVTVFEVLEDQQIRPVSSFGSFGVAAEEQPGQTLFNRPQSIEYDPARDEIVIADSGNHRVGRFNTTGERIEWLALPPEDIEGDGAFRYPYGVEVTGEGEILLTEFAAARVRLIDLVEGRILAQWGSPGREVGQLATPWAVAVRGREAFVLDSGNDRIVCFDFRDRPGLFGGMIGAAQ